MNKIGNELKTAYRNVRSSQNELRLAHRAFPGAVSNEFVQAIFDRYRGKLLRQPFLSLTFRQGNPGVTTHSTYQRTQVHLAPRIDLTVLAWSGSSMANSLKFKRQVETQLVDHLMTRLIYRSASAMPQAGAIAPDAPSLPHSKPDRRSLELITPVEQQLVQRLVTHKARIEGVVMAPRTASVQKPGSVQSFNNPASPSISVPLAQPVARVFRQTPPVPKVLEVAPATADIQSPAPSGAQVMNPRSPISEIPSAPIDLNRLTEQVVQAIDRRIVAQRERFGRF